MKKLMMIVKKKWLLFIALFPQKLPIGTVEFDLFCAKIFHTYDLPDTRSYKQCIATMIMHQSPTTFKVPLSFFGVSIKKAQANEIAYSVIQGIRKELEAEEKAQGEVEGLNKPIT